MAVERGVGRGPAFDGERLRLDQIGGAVAVTDREGDVVGVTLPASDLFARLEIPIRELPAPLPSSLRDQLAKTPFGVAMEWTPPDRAHAVRLGCTRYFLGEAHQLVLMREISEKHRELSRELQRQRLETTGRLVAAIVHDLRAPLGSIMLTVDGLRRELRDPPREVLSATEMIDQATRRMRRSIEGLLDFARLGPPVRDVVSVRDAVGAASRTLAASLRARGHRLETRIDSDRAWVVANRYVLEQVLVNLIQNAIESSDHTVEVVLETRASASSGPRTVDILIEDDGPGVPEEIRSRIFDPFFTTKRRGTGLGLANAREATRSMGGELELVPTARGATFCLSLAAGHAPAFDGALE
jgi:signal transduction histidine kinase